MTTNPQINSGDTDVCSIGRQDTVSTMRHDQIPYNRLDLSSITRNNVQGTTALGKRTTTEMVREMMGAYEQTIPDKPTWPAEADYRLRVRLDVEETMEKFHLGYYNGDAVQILDGSCDADVVLTGADLTFGFDHDGAVTEVNRSNMSKLDPVTGKPNKDAGGKVIKPDTYSPANLLPFVGDLAATKPEYDTQSIVREEFTKTLAKRIELVDFGRLAYFIVQHAEDERAKDEKREPRRLSDCGDAVLDKIDQLQNALLGIRTERRQ